MEQHEIELTKQSWQLVLPIADQAADLFYSRLFELAPSIEQMFASTDMSDQKGKLLRAISLVISNLHQPSCLISDIEALGHRHAGYGVLPQHYEPVGQALLWTLEQGLGDYWNEEVRAAWASAYGLIASAMIKGAGQTTTTGAKRPVYA